jgi:hypothetical protein
MRRSRAVRSAKPISTQGNSAEARKASLDEVRARLNSAVARGLETREAEDLCRLEDLRMEAVTKEAASS